MWSSRLFWRLFAVYVGLNLTLAIAFVVIVGFRQKERVKGQVDDRLTETANLLAHFLPEKLAGPEREALQPVVASLGKQTGVRVTLVDAAGRVLADSEMAPPLNDHSNRPELIEAATSATGRGWAQRKSPTLGIPMRYHALRLRRTGGEPDFVRVSLPAESIAAEVRSVQVLLWSLAAAVGVLAVGLTYIVVGRMINPISQLTTAAKAAAKGDYKQRVEIERNDELGQLARAFNRMQIENSRTVEELRQNSRQLATVLSSMAEGVIAVDSDQRILFANEAGKTMLEISSQNVVGQPLLEVTRIPSVYESVSGALRTGKAVQAEFEMLAAPRRTVTLRATPLPGDTPLGAVVVLHDVSDLRRLENLRQEFVANVSHELKTPLASIKAYAETLRLGAIEDTENNMIFIERIEEQADRLHQLILDMLQLARVESGQEAFELAEVSLAQAAQQAARRHAESASARTVDLNLAGGDRQVIVRADEEGVQTILDNLVDNAIKYTPEGGAVVIDWRADNEHGVLSVRDTGIGIPKKHHARIFERFYRVDKARSRELGGTGLGLSIVKHLTQAFGGSISIDSDVDRGSTFEVRLPLAAARQPPEAQEPSKLRGEG